MLNGILINGPYKKLSIIVVIAITGKKKKLKLKILNKIK